MGMSMSVIGFSKPDARWERMYHAYVSCEAAGVQPPPEVVEYFGGEAPFGKGLPFPLGSHPSVTSGTEDVKEWFDIDIAALPKSISVVRVVASW